ncbi:MAG: type II toxin-antitoxin system RelE/ParE family toxin [Verrucomicrobia bacterium]|nr:type II toxin-antitoxin system RelE/ParE family toxin [Verrucomicrobiota bacterium]
MSYGLDIWPVAEDDIRSAARWYNSEQSGLGIDFAEEVYVAIDSLERNPFLYRVRVRYRRREIRWLFPKRFPYRVIYYVEGPAVRIFVFAVLHAKRSDRTWKERV